MSKTSKPWTEEEDTTFKSIMTMANSVGEGLSLASRILKRSKGACSLRLLKHRREGFECTRAHKRKSYITEARVLKREIIRTPDNLTAAFKRTAEEIGMKPESVSSFYYGLDKNNPMYKGNLGVCFTIISADKTLVNTKNTPMKDE